MNISRFATNLQEARNAASIVVTAKNNVARDRASDTLNVCTENMIEELNAIVSQAHIPYLKVAKIDKDALLRSLLEDAESRLKYK